MSIYAGVIATADAEMDENISRWWGMSSAFLIALWIWGDAKQKGLHRPYELGALVLFFSYVVVPVYLLWSRDRSRFIPIITGIMLIFLLPDIVWAICYVLTS